jgi:hypothetical protein
MTDWSDLIKQQLENSATYIRRGALVGYNVTFKVVRIGRWHEISSQFVRVIHTTNTHTAACKQTFFSPDQTAVEEVNA